MNYLRIRVLAAAFAVTTLSLQALALPQIDPALRGLLTSSVQKQQMVKVIALFKDKGVMPRSSHSVVTHSAIEVALRENAKASQAATLRDLSSLTESGAPVRVRPLWIVNAAIIEMPASQLKRLAQNEDIRWIYANHQIHLVGVRGAGEFQGPATMADAFTYGLTKISLPELRLKAPQINGAGVRVGILDTGIDATHPDLKGRVVTFRDFVNKKTEPYDDHSHGTHVAGTIAGGNASGTTIGVAPGVKLVIGKILSGSGSGTWEGVLGGMQWIADPDGNPATDDAPRLVSNSWGGGTSSPAKDPADEVLCKALSGWVKLGILPVFAAGNAGPGPSSINLPGACPQALTIGATDQNDVIAPFSSRGPAVWKTGSILKPIVAAPGVKVLSSVPGGQYKEFSGTSMATPHTAGVAALVYQVNPKASIEDVGKALIAGAKPLGQGPNNDYGHGRIDALNSVKTFAQRMRSQGAN